MGFFDRFRRKPNTGQEVEENLENLEDFDGVMDEQEEGERISPLLLREALYGNYLETLTTVREAPNTGEVFKILQDRFAKMDQKNIFLLAYNLYTTTYSLVRHLSSFTSSTEVTLGADFNLRMIYDITDRLQLVPLLITKKDRRGAVKAILDVSEVLITISVMSEVLLELDKRYADFLEVVETVLGVLKGEKTES